MSETFPGSTRFRVLSHLGTGGMGVVYEALDLERDARVALKTLRIIGPSQLVRLKREFRALRDIQHPNLVALGELFEEGGTWFFTMELVHGVSIRAYVRPAPPNAEPGVPALGSDGGEGLLSMTEGDVETATSLSTADRVMSALHAQFGMLMGEDTGNGRRPGRQPRCFDEAKLRHALKGLGAGLAALHRAGKVHCDIKPSNVLVTSEDRVVVLDFGVVAELDGESSVRAMVAGSPAYMAPEQAAGEPVSPAADWYAVGVLLFELMTGQLPFRGATSAEIVARKLRGPAPNPDELVADVPADLATLCRELLATRPEARPAEADILATLGIAEARTWAMGIDVQPSLFIGRQDELARLGAAFDDSRRGRAVTVVLEGESGVGKTCTAEHFAASLGEGVLVLRGHCHEREFVPYNAFDGVVDDLVHHLRVTYGVAALPRVPAGVAPLLNVFPALRGVPGLAQAAAQDRAVRAPGDQRAHAFAGLRELFGWLAGEQPVVLVVHDVHWADADSVALLSELLGTRGSPPLLFIATVRASDGGSAYPAVDAVRGDVRRIPLGGLRGAEAEELARRLLARVPGAGEEAVGRMLAETGGHPMLMDELARHMARQAARASREDRAGSGDDGTLAGNGENGKLASNGDNDKLAGLGAHMPPRLEDALLARVRALHPAARRLLEAVAVSGMPLERSVAAEAADLTQEAVDRELMVLRAANLARAGGGGGQRDGLMPYHERVRAAVVEGLALENKRALHARLAQALEATGAEPGRLAPHYFHAGDLERSAELALVAARRARASLAFEQAVHLYRLALVARSHPPDEELVLLNELGMALQNAGRAREAADAYELAAERSRGSMVALDMRRKAAEQLLMGGYMADGVEAMRTVLAQVGMRFPSTARGALVGALGNLVALRLQRSWKTRPEREVPLSVLRTIDACWSAGAGLSLVDSTLGMLFATRGMRLALRWGEPYRLARAACTAAIAASAVDDVAAAERFLSLSERAAAQADHAEASFYAAAGRCVHGFFQEQAWRHTVERWEGLDRMWRAAGHGRGFELDFISQFGCWALAFLGDVGELGRRVEALVRTARQAGNRFLEVGLRVYHVLVHLAADDPAAGLADVADAIDAWLPGQAPGLGNDALQLPHVWALYSRTDAMLYLGQADERAGELEEEFRRLHGSPLRAIGYVRELGAYAEGRLAVVVAAAARRRGQRGRMKAELQRARHLAEVLDGTQRPVSRRWGALLRAGVAWLEGRQVEARFLLEDAAHALEASDTRLHAAAARYRLGQLEGGQYGAATMEASALVMRELGVMRPERIAAMLAPGWDEP